MKTHCFITSPNKVYFLQATILGDKALTTLFYVFFMIVVEWAFYFLRDGRQPSD